MATAAVLKYLKERNRPYSVNDILLNTHKEFGKTAVQKALEELTERGEVREKTYGKQKVYCVVQEPVGGGDQELQRLDGELKSKQETLKVLELEYKQCDATLKQLLSEPTTDEALEDNKRLESSNAELREKLRQARESGAEPVSEGERLKCLGERAEAVREYRKRKRLCSEMVEAVLEGGGYSRTKRHLLEEIGVETDEAVGLNPFAL